MHPRPRKPEGLIAPGINWRRRANGWVAYWVARGDIVAKGYSFKSMRLWPPSAQAQRLEPDAEEWQTISSACIRAQNEMLEWANPSGRQYDPRDLYDGTYESLDRIYQTDPDSPFQSLRHDAKRSYSSKSRSVIAAVGKARIPQLTFRDFKRWHEGFCSPNGGEDQPRHARGHGLMTHVRIVIGFGALLRLPGCKEAKDTLSDMEFQTPKRREEYMEAWHAIAIRRQAHLDGCPSIALAQALMFEFGARQKDVIGEYVPQSEPGISDVLDHGDKWILGMTWEEVKDGILEHRLSKSLSRADIGNKQAGKIKRYDLSLYPMVMEEISLIPLEKRKGPMVVAEHTGRPWRGKVFQRRWRKIANAAGVPKTIQNRDSRAGAATEADNSQAGEDRIRQALGHSRATTTRIYMRGEDAATAEVAVLRVKNRRQTP